MQVQPGTTTIVSQIWKAQKKNNISQHPQKRFLHDQKTYILSLQLDNQEILLGLDANLCHPADPEFKSFLLTANFTAYFANYIQIKVHHS